MTVVSGKSQLRRRSITPKAREVFLAALAEGVSVTHSALLAGHHRRRWYELRDKDEEFAALWADAWEAGADMLEDELRRRALGYDEVTYGPEGEVVRRVHRFDTTALIQWLKARRPETHRDNVQRLEAGPVRIILESAFPADYTPTTLADVVRLAAELGIDAVDGEAVEEPVGELESERKE